MKHLIRKTPYLIILLLILVTSARAQEVENDFQTRTSITLSTKLLKNLKLDITPELRFEDSFTLDKYLLEGKLSYGVSDNLSLGAGYRYYVNKRESKSTEFDNRYSFSIKYEKVCLRFEPSLKISYTNDSDDDSNSNLLRCKASVKYNIRKCKVTPFAGAEAFQEFNGDGLIKMRYFLGLDYKICKKNYIEASYKFDYFQNELKNKHIVSIGYKFKF
ncbi:hypothetical protein BZG01_17015 [Labilibaculum manganireducens]|uniref:Outer membrane protein beta-barrel domain-containing protein n=1 Tax=Labilibaculum manganireducens TaxID=1940525 RepID=A0A2N3HXB8_9BACT|nr:DUF2490 domain-containing protein [Labilibaculum manganireducens]PKQ62677.1 hypothetical protein BZG01_17015 [Labilibaculum manganireducens]